MSRPLRSIAYFLEAAMWFLFVLVPSTTALISLTGGLGFGIAAVAINVWHRMRGYGAGEGHFTERMNDTYYGVVMDHESTCDLNRNLGLLAQAVPSLLRHLETKSFDLTISEWQFLRVMLVPAMIAAADLSAAKELVVEQPGQEAIDVLVATTNQLAAVVIPVARWLEHFPRVKETS